MSTSFSSGLGWVVVDIAGVLLLAFVLIYATMMWRRRWRLRRPDTIGHESGPAPKRMEGQDDRPAAT